MKKFVSLVLLFVILMSLNSYSFAEDSISVNHTVINVNEELCDINVVMPYFEGFENSDEINRQIKNLIADSIGNTRATSKSLKKLKDELIEKGEETFDWETMLIISYDYTMNGDILSLKLDTYNYLGGAHGTSAIYSITINTKTGKIYTFKDLFKENTNSNEIITNRILNEIEKNPDMYFEENYKETIMNKDGEYKYYIDGDKLVIYFDLYDIAPYASGIPRFTIDADEIKELLKDEVYNSIKDGKERGIISYNGVDIDSNSKIVYQEYTPLVPLRDIAEILGYTVDWNKTDGAIVNGQIVEDGIVVDGVTYVPIKYFTETLGENVLFDISANDELLIKVYSKSGNENNFNNQIAENNFKNLIAEFEFPMTAEDAVNMYAEAVKMRNGAIQYGLMSDELREEKYDEIKELGFDTGTSSPWVDSYEIENIGDNLYKIVFYLKTSVPTDLITSTVNVKLIQSGDYWRISSIEEMSENIYELNIQN